MQAIKTFLMIVAMVPVLVDFTCRSAHASPDVDPVAMRLPVELPDRSIHWVVASPYPLLADDAQLVVVDEDGEQRSQPFPDIATMAGFSEVNPALRVAFTLAKDDTVRGIIVNENKLFELAGKINRSNPELSAPIPATDSLSDPVPPRATHPDPWCQADNTLAQDHVPFSPMPSGWSEMGRTPQGGGYKILLALDTDYEYFTLSGSVHEAVRHVFDLTLATSLIYEAQIDTRLSLRFLRIWTTAADPWTQAGNECQLREFGKHFNEQVRPELFFTAAMLVSGRLSGGLAWVKQLCRVPFNVGSPQGGGCTGGVAGSGLFGGPYGVAGVHGAPQVSGMTWDIYVFAHELGHIVASPHTHCFSGPIDQCYGSDSGCYAGATSLPGPPGQQTGTIMSYCHLRTGGQSNIAFSLGKNHAWGNQPQRVTNVMTAELDHIHGAAPWCVINDSDVLTVSVEKSGPVDVRIFTDPVNVMSPPLDCGDTCVTRRWRSWGGPPIMEDSSTPDWMVGYATGCDWEPACGLRGNGTCWTEDPGGSNPHIAVTTHLTPAATLELTSSALHQVNSPAVRADVQPDPDLDLRDCENYFSWIPLDQTAHYKYPLGARVIITANIRSPHPPGPPAGPGHSFLRWEGACEDQSTGPSDVGTCELTLTESTFVRALFGRAWGIGGLYVPYSGGVKPYVNGIPYPADTLWPPLLFEEESDITVQMISTGGAVLFVGYDEEQFGAACRERPNCHFEMPYGGVNLQVRFSAGPPHRLTNGGPVGYSYYSTIYDDAVFMFDLESAGDVVVKARRPPAPHGDSLLPRQIRLLVRKNELAGIDIADCIAESFLSGKEQVAEAECALGLMEPGRYFVNVRDVTQCEQNDLACWRPNSNIDVRVDAPTAASLYRLKFAGQEEVVVESLVPGFPNIFSGYEGLLLSGEAPIYRAPAEHEGLQFAGWSGCQGVDGRTCYVGAMNSDREITVHYASLDLIFAHGFE